MQLLKQNGVVILFNLKLYSLFSVLRVHMNFEGISTNLPLSKYMEEYK